MTLRLVTTEPAPAEAGETLVIEYDSSIYSRVTCIPIPGSGVVTVTAVKDGVETPVADALLASLPNPATL